MVKRPKRQTSCTPNFMSWEVLYQCVFMMMWMINRGGVCKRGAPDGSAAVFSVGLVWTLGLVTLQNVYMHDSKEKSQ